MKLRNIIEFKDATRDFLLHISKEVKGNESDTLFVNQDARIIKVPVAIEDLLLRNMELIEELIKKEK